LLGKCGSMLKPFLPQLQMTFLKALNDANRSVRLKAASALSKLIVIHTRVDPLFTELNSIISNTDDSAIRDTTLQALRGCVIGAGPKMNEVLRKQICETLQKFISANEDTTRITAAACLGASCTFLPEDELSLVLNLHLLDADPAEDWVVRHGRAIGLMIFLKEAALESPLDEYNPRIIKAIHSNVSADRIPIITAGLRSLGYCIKRQIKTDYGISNELINSLIKVMKNDSNDVKQLVAQVINFIAHSYEEPLDNSILKLLIPSLVNGTKEKNTTVKSCCESALAIILHLQNGDKILKDVLSIFEPGMKESLNEVASKILPKVMTISDAVECLDNTILT